MIVPLVKDTVLEIVVAAGAEMGATGLESWSLILLWSA